MKKQPKPFGDLKISLWVSGIFTGLRVIGAVDWHWLFITSPLLLYIGIHLVRLLIFIVYAATVKRDNFRWEMSVWFIMFTECISRDEAGIKYHYIQKRKQDARKRYPKP